MKEYQGSCFCSAVRFTATGDLAAGTGRCNCSFCRKMRYWEMRLSDPKGFVLTQGREHLAETPRQQNDDMDMHHYFCARCGTRLWTQGDIPELGGPFVMVCVNALDNATEAELAQAPITFINGAQDDWMGAAPETRYL